jgi:NitT/TauT family transport system substrate-binding protein
MNEESTGMSIARSIVVRGMAVLAKVVLAMALLATALPSAAQMPDKPKKITVLTNYAFFGRHAPLFTGVDKGYFREAGFDVQILPTTGSGFVNTAIDGNKADFALTDASVLVQSIAKGAQIQAFGVYLDISANGLASLQPIPSPESLLGRKIAAALTDSSRIVVPIIYNMKHLDASKLEWQAADPGTYFSLLLSGRVDVIAAAMDADRPALSKAAASQNKQVHFGAFADWGYDVFGIFLVTQAARIAAHPEEVKAFAAAVVKSVKYAIANPDEAARIMAEKNSTFNPEIVAAQWKASATAMQTDYVRKHGYGIATLDRLQRTISLARTALKIETELQPDQLFAQGLIAP